MHVIPREINWETPLPKQSRGFTLIELLTVLAIIFILLGVVVGGLKGCSPGYSQGSRVGTISKFTYKGFVNKSWEGQLVMGGMTTDSEGHAQANVWNFSVSDPAVVEKLQHAMDTGKRVKLTYTDGNWSLGQRDTTYLVTDVTIVGGTQ